MKKYTLLFALMLTGCHPFFMFKPDKLKLVNVNDESRGIEVSIDSFGIPFIKAKTTDEAIYGLGFMHARDRLFQLDLVRHAALGKTSELFGQKGLEFDKKLRLLSYRLDEQVKNLSNEENHLIEVYLKGVNEGAKKRGRTAEHFLLGTSFQELTKKDVVAIARLQSWQLGTDLFAEITRLKIARSELLPEQKKVLISAMDDQGKSVIRNAPLEQRDKWVEPTYLRTGIGTLSKQENNHDGSLSPLFGDGASNAWVVKSTLMDDGFASLMNDPHLQHNWPSNFYLATLESDDFFVTGASFVGLPGVVIGASKSLAWGVTASALNTQDAVLLKRDPKDPLAYIVDGQSHKLEAWPQTYCLKGGACQEEMYYLSLFGPVIGRDMDKWIDQDDIFAVQWTGFNVGEHHLLSEGFFDLARAKDIKAGVKAVQSMTLPGVNLVLADTLGNIAYAYAGIVPKRDRWQNPYLPLDGSLSTSKWRSFLPKKDKPQVINPEQGYIITANQNIFNAKAFSRQFGKQGAPPYRAVRIDERIQEMLKDKKALNFQELSLVQLDETSSEAKELAPVLGNLCLEHFKDQNTSKKTFAKAVVDFDGAFTTSSIGALPYEFLVDETLKAILFPVLGKDASGPGQYLRQVHYSIKRDLVKNEPEKAYPKLKEHMAIACDKAYERVVKKAGKSSWAWRWGRHHYLTRQSPIASAPIVGRFFKDKRREVPGSLSSPMAEVGLPVKYGANLRFKAKMTSPPQIYLVLDSGNSGTVGDDHSFDQASLWHEGKFVPMVTDWSQASKEKTRFSIE